MPRRARLRIAGAPLHIIQRGNNRSACFFADHDYGCYLHHLKELAARYTCSIHAYVMMTNHVHLLLTPGRPDGASLLMKHLGQRYVQYVNRVYDRSGTLWEGRFRSSIVQVETYLLRCQRYIELNPVRASIVDAPGAYPWSSFGANALGHRGDLITPHPIFLALGPDEVNRRAAYLELFRGEPEPMELEEIRCSSQVSAGKAMKTVVCPRFTSSRGEAAAACAGRRSPR